MAVLAARLVGNQDDIGAADFLTLTRNCHHHPFDLHNLLHHLQKDDDVYISIFIAVKPLLPYQEKSNIIFVEKY